MVRKGFVKDLVILMSISLIGIVLIQFYLLRQALNTSEETFSRNVTKALDEATDKLRDRELFHYFKEIYGTVKGTPEKKDRLSPTVKNSMIQTEKGDLFTSIYHFDDKAKDPLGVNKSDFKERKFVENLKKKKKGIEKIDSNFLPLSEAIPFGKNTFSLEHYIRVISSKTPIEKRIQPELIEGELNAEFKSHNIKPDYEFAVLNKYRCPTVIRSKGYEDQQEEMYDRELYLDEKGVPAYFLSVYFPRKSITILNSIFGIVILSVIVISVITGVYAASLFYMDRQKKISEMKNDFVNNMTHEFKTPIATINVVTDILRNPAINTSPEKVEHYATIIKNENVRMDNQIEMVLRIAKLDHNQLELDFKNVDVDDLVSKAVERIRLVVEERQGEILETYNAPSIQIHVDPLHFENVILNILDNANKYSLDPPRIKVRTFVKNQSIFIQIEDEGMGMSKQVQQRIFEKFFRAEGGNLHNVRGHGLGLPYVKKIVDLYKFSIRVESEKGKGTEFTIEMPLKATFK